MVQFLFRFIFFGRVGAFPFILMKAFNKQ